MFSKYRYIKEENRQSSDYSREPIKVFSSWFNMSIQYENYVNGLIKFFMTKQNYKMNERLDSQVIKASRREQ